VKIMDKSCLNQREQQRLKRRKEILECSLDMIITRGYSATKIRDIANKLQMSVGLFFNYFESKEKVYEELVKISLSGPESVLKEKDKAEPIAFFEKTTERIFQSIQSHSITAKMFLLMSQTIRSESAPDSVKALVADFDAVTPIIPVLEKGQKLGQIKQGDPVALAIAYWGAVQGVAQSVALQPGLPFPESRWIVDILRA